MFTHVHVQHVYHTTFQLTSQNAQQMVIHVAFTQLPYTIHVDVHIVFTNVHVLSILTNFTKESVQDSHQIPEG